MCCAYTRPRYQVSNYRTIGLLVNCTFEIQNHENSSDKRDQHRLTGPRHLNGLRRMLQISMVLFISVIDTFR